jgi:uncharacterized membrane protein YeaQ/YmgE (transglycosylase-associated protein family)
MAVFADLGLNPGGVVAWLVVGLLAGWLAGKVLGGTEFGVILDIILGLAGALIGGILFGRLVRNSLIGVILEFGLLVRMDASGVADFEFWGSVVVAFLGACNLIAGGRALGSARLPDV